MICPALTRAEFDILWDDFVHHKALRLPPLDNVVPFPVTGKFTDL